MKITFLSVSYVYNKLVFATKFFLKGLFWVSNIFLIILGFVYAKSFLLDVGIVNITVNIDGIKVLGFILAVNFIFFIT